LSGERKGNKLAESPAVPVDLLLATGERLQRRGDRRRRRADLPARCSPRIPRRKRATQLLGAMLVDRHQIDEAIDLFEAAAPHVGAPSLDTSGFYNNFANALRRAGRLPSAEAMLRALVAAAPNDWRPWHNLGQTLKDLGRNDEARGGAAARGHARTRVRAEPRRAR